MLKITEKILLHQVKNGNEHAFAHFYNTYKKDIYRFIYFKVSDEEKAQDLTDEAFLKIFNCLQDGEEINNFRAFLYKIARNLTIDFYRTRHDRVSLEDVPEVVSDIDISEKVGLELDFQNITRVVKKLPDNYKEIITLKFINELSFDEISKITGKSPENCRMLTHRGLKKLRVLLKK